MNEQEQFLDELGKEEDKNDLFEQPLVPEKAADGEAEGEQSDQQQSEDDEQKLRNRRERRLAAKYQAEHESSIQLAARLAAITEASRARSDESAEYLKSVERIYGTSTPEATEATELLKAALRGVKEEATREAVELYRQERDQEAAAVRKEEQELDAMIEEIEDEHNVVLSDSQQRGFFQLLEKMSPKDRDGNVVEYADPSAVWEIYQANTRKPDNRAKSLASRSMTRSGASQDSKLQDDSTTRFLKDNGII